MSRIVSVVSQVMPCRGREPRRQPSAHVSPPVNLLKRDVVESKTYERAGDPAILEYPFEHQEGQCIRAKKRHDAPGIAREVHISGRIWGFQCRVMHHVLLGENPLPAVQEEPVQAVFKSVRVDEANQQSEQETGTGRSNKLYGDEYQRQTRKERRDQVISLDPQSLRSGFSPNDAI